MSQLTADRPLSAVAGRYEVHLSKPNSGIAVWRVEVRHAGIAGRPVDDLTRSYTSECLARTIARVLTFALRTPGANVATARRAVVRHIDAELAMLVPSVQSAAKAEILFDLRAGFANDLAAVTA